MANYLLIGLQVVIIFILIVMTGQIVIGFRNIVNAVEGLRNGITQGRGKGTPYTTVEFKELTLMINTLIIQTVDKYLKTMFGESENGELHINEEFIEKALVTVGEEIFGLINPGLFEILEKYLSVEPYIKKQVTEHLIASSDRYKKTIKLNQR